MSIWICPNCTRRSPITSSICPGCFILKPKNCPIQTDHHDFMSDQTLNPPPQTTSNDYNQQYIYEYKSSNSNNSNSNSSISNNSHNSHNSHNSNCFHKCNFCTLQLPSSAFSNSQQNKLRRTCLTCSKIRQLCIQCKRHKILPEFDRSQLYTSSNRAKPHPRCRSCIRSQYGPNSIAPSQSSQKKVNSKSQIIDDKQLSQELEKQLSNLQVIPNQRMPAAAQPPLIQATQRAEPNKRLLSLTPNELEGIIKHIQAIQATGHVVDNVGQLQKWELEDYQVVFGATQGRVMYHRSQRAFAPLGDDLGREPRQPGTEGLIDRVARPSIMGSVGWLHIQQSPVNMTNIQLREVMKKLQQKAMYIDKEITSRQQSARPPDV